MAIVLLVDDEPDALAALQVFLALEGIEVIMALSAAEALRLVEQQLPDLIITDCLMPGTNGLDLCRMLRARPKTRQIPIILHTAVDSSLLTAEPGLYEAIIAKPADLEEFGRIIQAQLFSGFRGTL